MCFPTLLSLFFYKSFSRFLYIQLYSDITFVKKAISIKDK